MSKTTKKPEIENEEEDEVIFLICAGCGAIIRGTTDFINQAGWTATFVRSFCPKCNN